MLCGDRRFDGSLVARDSCKEPYGGYALGTQIQKPLSAQGVCFEKLEENPDPTAYRISDIEDHSNVTPVQWSVWWGVPVPEWQEPLPEAMARYSAVSRATVKPLYTGVHDNLRVAYLEPPIERIPDRTGLNEHWEWPYAARLAVNVYRAKKLDPANPRLLWLAKELKLDPYNLDGSKPHVEIHPARSLKTWPTLAYTRNGHLGPGG